MLLTITTTHAPATDLGYLLAKKPDKLQTFSLGRGQAHVFYPVAPQVCCTAALLLDIDPIGLVRGRHPAEVAKIGQYVNDPLHGVVVHRASRLRRCLARH